MMKMILLLRDGKAVSIRIYLTGNCNLLGLPHFTCCNLTGTIYCGLKFGLQMDLDNYDIGAQAHLPL